MSETETELYRDNMLVVTSWRVVTPASTIAMQGVISSSVRRDQPSPVIWSLVAFAGAIIAAFGGIRLTLGTGMVEFTLGLLIMTAGMWRTFKQAPAIVSITTAGGSVDVLVTPDSASAAAASAAISHAIVSRRLSAPPEPQQVNRAVVEPLW